MADGAGGAGAGAGGRPTNDGQIDISEVPIEQLDMMQKKLEQVRIRALWVVRTEPLPQPAAGCVDELLARRTLLYWQIGHVCLVVSLCSSFRGCCFRTVACCYDDCVVLFGTTPLSRAGAEGVDTQLHSAARRPAPVPAFEGSSGRFDA